MVSSACCSSCIIDESASASLSTDSRPDSDSGCHAEARRERGGRTSVASAGWRAVVKAWVDGPHISVGEGVGGRREARVRERRLVADAVGRLGALGPRPLLVGAALCSNTHTARTVSSTP